MNIITQDPISACDAYFASHFNAINVCVCFFHSRLCCCLCLHYYLCTRTATEIDWVKKLHMRKNASYVIIISYINVAQRDEKTILKRFTTVSNWFIYYAKYKHFVGVALEQAHACNPILSNGKMENLHFAYKNYYNFLS